MHQDNLKQQQQFMTTMLMMMQGGMMQGGMNIARESRPQLPPQLPQTSLGGYVFCGTQWPEEEKEEMKSGEPEGNEEEEK